MEQLFQLISLLATHATCGSPPYPLAHVHIGLCLITVHTALDPQLQGSLHFLFKQASDSGHSESWAQPLTISVPVTVPVLLWLVYYNDNGGKKQKQSLV